MNITTANKRIAALNQIAEGVALLAQVIEEEAWELLEDHAGMPGVRPLAATQLVQPAIEQTEPPWDDQPESQPADTPSAPVAPAVSLEQVRGVLAGLSQAGHTARVRELIQAAGAEKLSEVAPGKYQWLLEQAEGITNA